jgi:hypothetical protein
VSARGSVRAEVLGALERAKAEAQRSKDGEPFAFASWERGFLVLPYGRRAYPYVLLGRDCGLTVRGNDELPPVRADIYSGYLHTVGVRDWWSGRLEGEGGGLGRPSSDRIAAPTEYEAIAEWRTGLFREMDRTACIVTAL